MMMMMIITATMCSMYELKISAKLQISFLFSQRIEIITFFFFFVTTLVLKKETVIFVSLFIRFMLT